VVPLAESRPGCRSWTRHAQRAGLDPKADWSGLWRTHSPNRRSSEPPVKSTRCPRAKIFPVPGSPVVIGEAEGPGRKADHRSRCGERFIFTAQSFPAQACGAAGRAPGHPFSVVVITRRFTAGVFAEQGAVVGVVAEFHRPGEVVNRAGMPIHVASPARFSPIRPMNRARNPRVGGVQPDPQILERRGFEVGPMHGVRVLPSLRRKQPSG